jgi:hypothetical protein
MYDEYVFKGEKNYVGDIFLHNQLFDTFYSDLCSVGVEGIKQLRKSKKSKIQTLERCISHYEKIEEYERCSYIQNILKQII